METFQREQIRLIVTDLSERAHDETGAGLKAMYADHAARGLLASGATIKVAVREMEKIAEKLISGCVDRVSPVAKDTEAFAIIAETINTFLSFMAASLEGPISKVTGRMADRSLNSSVPMAARKLFDESRQRLLRQLEIHRFAFTYPASGSVAARTDVAVFAPPPDAGQLPAKNKGGKPLAAHWDEMWSEVAAQLWLGDLKPTKQADITKAMLDWFAARNIDIGETAVTDRARQLWRRIEPEL